MKMKTFCFLVCLLLLAVSASSPTTTHASDWVDDLEACITNYVNGVNGAWDDFYASARTDADSDDLAYRLDVAFYNYEACNGIVNVPVTQPDFCTGAIIAAQNCNAQFAGLGVDASFAYMECIAKTGVDSCR